MGFLVLTALKHDIHKFQGQYLFLESQSFPLDDPQNKLSAVSMEILLLVK